MSFIFDELKYAQTMFGHNANVDKKIGYSNKELTIFAKWLRNVVYKNYNNVSEDQKETMIHTSFTSFCEQEQKDYDETKYEKRINMTLRYSKIYDIRDNLKCIISKSEWDVINKIKNSDAKKLCFGLLVLYRYNSLNPVKRLDGLDLGIRKSNKLIIQLQDVYDYMGIKLRTFEKENSPEKYYEPLKILIDEDMINVEVTNTKKWYTFIFTLSFLNKPNIIKSEPLISITNYDMAEEYYDILTNDNTKLHICPNCGSPSRYGTVTCGVCVNDSKRHNVQFENKLGIDLGKFDFAFCEKCGKRRKINAKTQTNKCPECYLIYKKEKQILPLIETKCHNCGKRILFPDSNKKKPVCDECKKEIRKEKDRIRKRNKNSKTS